MSTNTENTSEQTPKGFAQVKAHILEDKVRAALWATRGLTVFFVLSYLLPVFSSSTSSYQKAMMCNAATSALRLTQRIPNIAFTREFLTSLFMEDSAHYLLYSMIFMYTAPITMVLVPVFLFAVLHFSSFSIKLLDLMGTNNALVSRYLIDFIELQHKNMLRIAAFTEITILPLVVAQLFRGYVSLLTPMFYYRFLLMRYSSRRNSYTRIMFYELRVATQSLTYHSYVPQFAKKALLKGITFISQLAPLNTPAQ